MHTHVLSSCIHFSLLDLVVVYHTSTWAYPIPNYTAPHGSPNPSSLLKHLRAHRTPRVFYMHHLAIVTGVLEDDFFISCSNCGCASP